MLLISWIKANETHQFCILFFNFIESVRRYLQIKTLPQFLLAIANSETGWTSPHLQPLPALLLTFRNPDWFFKVQQASPPLSLAPLWIMEVSRLRSAKVQLKRYYNRPSESPVDNHINTHTPHTWGRKRAYLSLHILSSVKVNYLLLLFNKVDRISDNFENYLAFHLMTTSAWDFRHFANVFGLINIRKLS